MIIVKATEQSEAGVLPTQEQMAEMASYHEELAKAGVLLDASGLRASAHGWRVKYAGGGKKIVDGPFAETKELIAGYTIIQVKSREEAVEWTRRFPNPAFGQDCHIEVRRLFELEDFEEGPGVDRFKDLDAGRRG
jgi:hypothetical protein